MVDMPAVEAMTADPTAATLTFEDLGVLTTGGVDVFLYDANEGAHPPAYYITVAGMRFAFTGSTYLEKGHGAVLPRWVRAEEAAARVVLVVRRSERLLAYVHDPAAAEDGADVDEA